jgi:regulator of protease activity HflC (stomatin/prohibitin superfamily)
MSISISHLISLQRQGVEIPQAGEDGGDLQAVVAEVPAQQRALTHQSASEAAAAATVADAEAEALTTAAEATAAESTAEATAESTAQATAKATAEATAAEATSKAAAAEATAAEAEWNRMEITREERHPKAYKVLSEVRRGANAPLSMAVMPLTLRSLKRYRKEECQMHNGQKQRQAAK